MVSTNEVSEQMKRLGARFQFWCRPEIRELPKILFEGEQLKHILVGRYEGGFALLCSTDKRVLLVDKKPFYLTLEDIRYDMISDVQYNHRLLDSTVRLGTMHKTLSFTAYNHVKLRSFTSHIQEQVMLYRQQQNNSQQDQPAYEAGSDTRPFAAGSRLPGVGVVFNATAPKQTVVNPYNMPIMIRRRISRFY